MRARTVVPPQGGTPAVSDMPEPQESDGPVLVETLAVGLCGTDIEILLGERRVSRQVPIERWSEVLQRQPDDVKVVIEVNPT